MTKELTPISSSPMPPQPYSRYRSRLSVSRGSHRPHQSSSPALLGRLMLWLGRLFRRQDTAKTRSRRRRSLTLHWVIPNKLAIGALPRSGDSAILAKAGITAILSLCAEQEGVLPADVAQSFYCGRTVLPDSHYANALDPEQLLKAVEVVHYSLQRNMPVYVHCLGGIERAPLVCITYLCLYRGLDLSDALIWLKQVHPRTNPTEEQVRILEASVRQARESSG